MAGGGDNTSGKYRGLKEPWKPGQSGNPAGRPKGSKNALAEHFIADLQAKWKEKGKEVIDAVIADKPADFLKVVASVIPKEVKIERTAVDELQDGELADYLALARAAYEAHSAARGRASEESAGKPPGDVSSVH